MQGWNKTGWVVVFMVACSSFYLHAIGQKESEYKEMVARLQTLEKEKEFVLQQQQELALQIKSQSDPAWVEMVLKRNLGLVPMGQTKVYFQSKQ